MSTQPAESGHGNSPAAWTAVVIALVGFAVGTIAFWFAIVPVVWISAGVVVLAFVIGGIMKKLGYGVDGDRTAHSKAHS
jgi:CBS-domain-containing membrane protein